MSKINFQTRLQHVFHTSFVHFEISVYFKNVSCQQYVMDYSVPTGIKKQNKTIETITEIQKKNPLQIPLQTLPLQTFNH